MFNLDFKTFFEEKIQPYIDPDRIYGYGRPVATFIFFNDKLYVGKNSTETHWSVTQRLPHLNPIGALRGRVGYPPPGDIEQNAASKDLLIVSFWNTNKKAYDNNLAACLQALQNKQLQAKTDLYRKVHIMRGNAKKDAMKKLGLGWVSKKNRWQQEMEKAGQTTPGNKSWAPTSEGNYGNK